MGKEDFQNYYYLLYGVSAFFVLIFALNQDFKRNISKKPGFYFSIIFILAFIVLFGFRGEKVGTDTALYIWQFQNYDLLGIDIDFLYSYLLIFLNKFTEEKYFFLLTMAIANLIPLTWACYNFAKKLNVNVFFLLFSFFSMFFFQTLGTNILRQGIGLSFFLLGVSFYLKNSKLSRNMIIAFLFAIGFHFTTIIPVLIFVIISSFKNIKIKIYYFFYVITLLLSIAKVSLLTFVPFLEFLLVDERRSGYLKGTSDGDYIIGFKPQFVLFNTFFLIFFYWILKYKKGELQSYDQLLKYYLVMSSIFFLTFQLPYSDRWGVMSWVVIPFLLSPVFINNKYQKTASVCSFILILVFVFFNTYK